MCSKPSQVVPEGKREDPNNFNKVVPYDGDDENLSWLSHDNPNGYHNSGVLSRRNANKAALLAAKLAESYHDKTLNNSVSSGVRTR